MQVYDTPFSSTQKNELFAVWKALEIDEPINVITDSRYVATLIPDLETACISTQLEIGQLLAQVQNTIRGRMFPFHILHIRSHSNLPGPLAEGNEVVDRVVSGGVYLETTEEAQQAHNKFHISAKS